MRPGSVPWLIGHELRLLWRESRRDKGRIVQLIALAVVLIALVGVGIPIGLAVREMGFVMTPATALAVDLVIALIFTLMVSSTLARAAQVLYVRGDLDLLLSSPLSPATVLTVRFAGIAFTATVFWLVLATGLMIPIALLGTPQWLAAIVVLLALGLVASATGLVLTTSLFRLLGPRRTRTFAQVLAAVVGASLFLVFQLPQMIRGDSGYSRWGWIGRYFTGEASVTLPPGADIPARAAVGEPVPLLIMVGACLAVFLLVNHSLGRRFARDAASAIGADTSKRRAGRAGAFAADAFSATLRKELRLLLRDIALFSQVLLRVLYLIPLAFVLLRNANDDNQLLLPGGAAALAVVAGQLAGSFTWITVSAEDAPDLLVASPAPFSVINRAKLWAGLIPTGGLLALPLAALIVLAPLTGIAATLGCAAAAWSAGAISLWHQKPGRRADFRRRGNVHWLIALAIFAIGGLIGLATFLVATGDLLFWAIIPAVLAAVLTLAMRRSDDQILETLRSES